MTYELNYFNKINYYKKIISRGGTLARLAEIANISSIKEEKELDGDFGRVSKRIRIRIGQNDALQN